ncbi:MAG: branched-chain amino acid ABC transporter permease [Nitrospinae bacterium]|nr:branched-chain amino acid ABC transporter permease [Nitrospinota bacterium]
MAASPDVEIRVEDASRIRSREIATRVLLAVSALLVLAVPFLNASPFFITLLTEALIFGIWAMSLDLLVGYTGLVSFGHAASFGFATYAAGIFAMNVSADFFLSTIVAILAAAAVAFFTGLVVTRLSGIAFAILTLCICQVLFQISVVWRSFTGGLDGLIGVPLPTLFGREVEPGEEFYLLTAVTLMVESPFGKTLLAIRANEDRAAAIGIDVRRHKLVILILSWMTGGVAGTLFVFLKAGANPMTLYWIESGNILAITILGGIGTLFGPIIGAIGFIFIRDEVTTLYRAWQFSFGLAFVLAVLFMPSGIAGVAEKIWRRLWPARS